MKRIFAVVIMFMLIGCTTITIKNLKYEGPDKLLVIDELVYWNTTFDLDKLIENIAK